MQKPITECNCINSSLLDAVFRIIYADSSRARKVIPQKAGRDQLHSAIDCCSLSPRCHLPVAMFNNYQANPSGGKGESNLWAEASLAQKAASRKCIKH
jgi:hypothetical protein